MRLLLLFTVVPALELILLIEIGSRIGSVATLALVILTGIAGAALARREGLGVIRRVRREADRGEVPGRALMEGASVLAGGLLLLTPGFMTDVLGFALLLPPTRRLAIAIAERRVRRWIDLQYVGPYHRRDGP